MTVSEERRVTKSSRVRTPRADWIEQQKAIRQSWFADHRRIGNLKLTGNERNRGSGYQFEWVCSCGTHGWGKWSDLKLDVERSPDRSCRACASKKKMHRIMQTDAGKAHQALMTAKAAILNRKHPPKPKCPKRTRYPTQVNGKPTPYGIVLATMHRAFRRCNSTKDKAYANYGGRGIKFLFPDVYAATDWVIANLGYRPTGKYSIDRIDNNRHYEMGNLRWATDQEQANNKREYKRREVGERVRRLQAMGCPFCYETIRSWIKQGMTDDEIINRKHTGSGRPRKR